MPALTLLAIATNMAIRNIHFIQDFADMPWDMAKPVLKRVDNPWQLYKIELNSPQFADHDEELWLSFIERDFPHIYRSKDFSPPHDGQGWYLVYFAIWEKEKAKRKEHEAELKKSMQDGRRAQKETALVDKVLPMPREPPRHDRRVYNPKLYARHDLCNMPTRQTTKQGAASNARSPIATLRRESAKRSRSLALSAQSKRAVDIRKIELRAQQEKKLPAYTPKDHIVPKVQPRAVVNVKPREQSQKKPDMKAVTKVMTKPDKQPGTHAEKKPMTKTDMKTGKKLDRRSETDAGKKSILQTDTRSGKKTVGTVKFLPGEEQPLPVKPVPLENRYPKKLTTKDRVKQGETIDDAVRQSLSEREAKLKAIEANAIPRPETPPPPSPKIVIPNKLPFDAVITTEYSPTSGEEHYTHQFEESLPPAPPALIVIQKRKAPVNPFVPKKKRMT